MTDHTVKTESYSCLSCGGAVQFDPDTQNLKCQFCKTITAFEHPVLEIKSYALAAGFAQCETDWEQELRVIHCNSCGAETVLEGSNTSQLCAFCDSPHISDLESQPGIKPESLIPFKLSAKRAKESFKKWIKGKFFAQTEAKKNHRIENLKGIYIPYWVFDTDTSTAYTGRRGVTVTTGSGKDRRTTTHWTNVSGVYYENFRDINICGSDQIKKMGLAEKLEYKFEELQGYNPIFLTGFVAEKYIKGVDDSWERCKNGIRELIKNGIKMQIGGDQQQITGMDTNHTNSNYRHVLCPAWTSVFKYKGKEYPFIVNGQTGKIEGKYPLSIPKIAGTIIFALVIIYMLVRYFG